ncbi:MAG: periplasmic heavy metal sensor [Candidatus Binatia bacterium]
MNKVLLMTAFAVGLTASALHAQPHMRGGPMGGPPGMGPDAGMLFPMILDKLDLTADQEARVRAILETHRPTLQGLFPRLRAAQESLATRLFQAAALAPEDLTADVDQLNQTKAQVVQEGIRTALEIRGILTPAQLAKAAEIHGRLQALHEEMRQILGDPPGPPPMP